VCLHARLDCLSLFALLRARFPPALSFFAAEGTLACPRCESENTKFCYYNNYNIKQPRYFCRVRVCCPSSVQGQGAGPGLRCWAQTLTWRRLSQTRLPVHMCGLLPYAACPCAAPRPPPCRAVSATGQLGVRCETFPWAPASAGINPRPLLCPPRLASEARQPRRATRAQPQQQQQLQQEQQEQGATP
jgi:hypothetical protein